MAVAGDNRSVGELLRDLAADAATLVRQELSLARVETEEKLHASMAALVAMLAGALLAFAALIVLLDAVVYALADAGLDRWLAALIVGGWWRRSAFCWSARVRTISPPLAWLPSGPRPASARTSIWSRSRSLEGRGPGRGSDRA